MTKRGDYYRLIRTLTTRDLQGIFDENLTS